MGDKTPADRRDEHAPEREHSHEDDRRPERPLGPFGDEDRPQAEPAGGEAPLEHLVTGEFGDTTPEPRSRPEPRERHEPRLKPDLDGEDRGPTDDRPAGRD